MKKLFLAFVLCLALPAAAAAQATPSAIENGAAIARVNFERPRGTLRVIQFGDSHTAGQFFTSEYARLLGARVTADGVNGARLQSLRSGARRAHFRTVLAMTRPDLVVIAYGTNEVTDKGWTAESYARLVVDVISDGRRASPSTAFIVIAPFDRSVRTRRGWLPVGRLEELEGAQREGARRAGAAFWSSYRAQGGPGAMNQWVRLRLAQPDHVHLRPPGYRRLAALFSQALRNNFKYQLLISLLAF